MCVQLSISFLHVDQATFSRCSLYWLDRGFSCAAITHRNMDDFQNFVARVVGRGPDGQCDEHYLLPVGKAPAQAHFRECVLDSKMFVAALAKLEMFFSQKTWYIAEEGRATKDAIAEYLARIDIDRYPQKGDVWTPCGTERSLPALSFTCNLITIDQYSSTMLLGNWHGGVSETNQLATFKAEYNLAHAQCFTRFHVLESKTASIEADTVELKASVGDLQRNQIEILKDQSVVNESLDERLSKLEKLQEHAAGPPTKKQRVDKRCPNRHHERVQKHQWLSPGDMVLLLGNHHSLQKVVFESWAQTHYIVCEQCGNKTTTPIATCCGCVPDAWKQMPLLRESLLRQVRLVVLKRKRSHCFTIENCACGMSNRFCIDSHECVLTRGYIRHSIVYSLRVMS